MSEALIRKYRQAAFTYLHVGLLYEAAVIALWRQGLAPTTRGPIVLWLVLGAAIVGLVFWALWTWRNRWFARGVWAVHALRLPALMGGAFLPGPDPTLPPSFYLTALLAVVVNLWMLARAGWDL
jgi:hypothetical protein